MGFLRGFERVLRKTGNLYIVVFVLLFCFLFLRLFLNVMFFFGSRVNFV